MNLSAIDDGDDDGGDDDDEEEEEDDDDEDDLVQQCAFVDFVCAVEEGRHFVLIRFTESSI